MSYLEFFSDHYNFAIIISSQSNNHTNTGYHIAKKQPSYRYKISYRHKSLSYRFEISYHHCLRDIMSPDFTLVTVLVL